MKDTRQGARGSRDDRSIETKKEAPREAITQVANKRLLRVVYFRHLQLQGTFQWRWYAGQSMT